MTDKVDKYNQLALPMKLLCMEVLSSCLSCHAVDAHHP